MSFLKLEKGGFIVEHGLVGFPKFGKKCHLNLCCHFKRGAKKRLKDKYFF